ncbi:LysR family transcriptional regulator [Parvularcula flava]|uniref:LysR family transcriptional regulator n=1 Tax=Aquisalinus luteolus TaxID=1566827 RepID=A0A8J3EP59_9PROT|nr:LysR family transcriptional regulator [Aquisalinus luteolus]NHK27184.1 LysR family transcriptional regulator [Aquisalinus luteolus]GGH94663.1 LysR family transcriptional regulator [Aquisalinus luteolus]
MKRDELGDLLAFLAVEEEASFTRAAARLGVSQSSLSHTVRRLEERLGVRLLTRTTRTVSSTQAGEQLAKTLRPAFAEIEGQLAALSSFREKPAGSVRINSSQLAADTILWPKLVPLLKDYPDIKLELITEGRMVDIVAERFDAGVRLGESIEKDMIAVRIGPELRMAVVGSPAYFAKHGKPKVPDDLTNHRCINRRTQTHGDLFTWEFEKNGREINFRTDGGIVFNTPSLVLDAALEDMGIGYIAEPYVENLLAEKKLIRVLNEWCPSFPGFHLYYPSRRQPTPAFSLVLNALRCK